MMFGRIFVCVALSWAHATWQDTCLRQFLRCHFSNPLTHQPKTVINVNKALNRTYGPLFRSDGTINIGHMAVFNVYCSANAPKSLVFSPRKIEINQNLKCQIFYPFIYFPINITNVKRASIKTCRLSISKNKRKNIGNIAIFLVLLWEKLCIIADFVPSLYLAVQLWSGCVWFMKFLVMFRWTRLY